MPDARASDATDAENAPLLQRSAPDDEEHIDHDDRTLKKVLQHPNLLTTLEQGLVVLAIVLLCLSAVFGGVALGINDRLNHYKEKVRDPTPHTSTLYATTTATVTASGSTGPAPTSPPTRPPSKNVR